MTTAFYASAVAGDEATAPSKLSLIAKRLANALIESRTRSAERKLRQYEAFIQDLSRRQDHSADFLIQDNFLPVKV